MFYACISASTAALSALYSALHAGLKCTACQPLVQQFSTCQRALIRKSSISASLCNCLRGGVALIPLLFSASFCKLRVVQNAAILGSYERHLLQGNPLQPLNSALTPIIIKILCFSCFHFKLDTTTFQAYYMIEDTLSLQVHNLFMIGYFKKKN